MKLLYTQDWKSTRIEMHEIDLLIMYTKLEIVEKVLEQGVTSFVNEQVK